MCARVAPWRAGRRGCRPWLPPWLRPPPCALRTAQGSGCGPASGVCQWAERASEGVAQPSLQANHAATRAGRAALPRGRRERCACCAYRPARRKRLGGLLPGGDVVHLRGSRPGAAGPGQSRSVDVGSAGRGARAPPEAAAGRLDAAERRMQGQQAGARLPSPPLPSLQALSAPRSTRC